MKTLELNEKRELIALRAVVSLILGYALLYAPENALAGSFLAFAAVAAHLLSNAVLLRVPNRVFERTAFLAALMIADLGLIAWAMARAGDGDSDFYLIFFLVILMSGMQRDVRLSFLVGGVASVLYAVLWSKANPLAGLLDAATMLRFPFFFIVSFFAACFVRRTQNQERALDDARDRLAREEKTAAIGRLAGGMAHEFNSLLTVILGNTTFLDESFPADDPRRAETNGIFESVGRATGLIAQLMNYSGRQPILPARVDVRDMIEDERPRLREILGEAVDLRLKLPEGLPRISIDRGQMRQLLTCLAANAREATGGKGTFSVDASCLPGAELPESVSTGKTGRYVRLRVADDGRGVPPERTAQLFEPFFPASDDGRAADLSLASVYGIVKRADGDVRVEAAPGVGTTFSIYFPALAQESRDTRLY